MSQSTNKNTLLPRSILQNPDKTAALAVLPATAPLPQSLAMASCLFQLLYFYVLWTLHLSSLVDQSGYMATLDSYTSLTKNHSRCAYLNASSSMDVIWFFISLMDSTVTGPITSFSRTCKPASMISKCVTPGIGKSANNKKQNIN